MSKKKDYDLVEDRAAIIDEFEKTMTRKFKPEEAEGISFDLGLYVTDVNIGFLCKVDDGKLEIQKDISKREIENSDVYLFCTLDTFERLESNELSIPDIMSLDDDDTIIFGGDIGLMYELYNIFELPI